MKLMFDTSEKLMSEQSDEINGVKTINWENSSWKYLSLVGDEQVISLQRTKVYVFADSVLCLGKMNENLRANTAREERLARFKKSPQLIMRSELEPKGVRCHHQAVEQRCACSLSACTPRVR